jgi:hypothetical protein
MLGSDENKILTLKIRIRNSAYGFRLLKKFLYPSSEGVETGLTVRQVLEQSHIVATLGKNNFLKLDPAILLREAQNISLFFTLKPGHGYGPGCHWITDPDPDRALFFSGFQDANIN